MHPSRYRSRRATKPSWPSVASRHFARGGPGGQHQNATESGVRLVHLPTGIRVTAREERSQHRNKIKALERLRAKLEELNVVTQPRKRRRMSKAEKEKRLEEKRRRSEKKRLRKPPKDPGD